MQAMNNDAFSVLFGNSNEEQTSKKTAKPQQTTPQALQTEKPEVKITTIEAPKSAPQAVISPIVEKVHTPAPQASSLPQTTKKSSLEAQKIQQKPTVQKKQKKKSDFFARFPLGAKIKNLLSETKAMMIIFLSILCVFYFFTNAQLVFYTIKDVFASVNAAELNQISETLMHNAAGNTKEENIRQIEERFAQIQEENTSGSLLSLGMDELVQ